MSEDPGRWEDYDESSVRIRPGRGSRPRSKVRPRHEDAVPGMVVAVDRGRFRVVVDLAEPTERSITASAARELGRGAVVVGDRVAVVGDTSGADGALARIVRVEPRTTLLRRSADDAPTGERDERIIVANADLLIIVVAAADPEPRTRLIDRYLIAAVDVGIEPLLVVTKADLANPGELLRAFPGVRALTSTREDPPTAVLTELIQGRIAVAVGHSGVGKSTLVNALVPAAQRATGVVNSVTGRGRHTSSSTVAYRLGTGWVIDTPGIRSFGLGHVDPANILRAFPELEAIAEDPEHGCPRGCTHLVGVEECAIAEAATAGTADAERVDSLQRLLAALA